MKTIAEPNSTMHEQEVRVPIQMAMDNTIDVQESREGEIHQTVNNTEMKNSAESDGSKDHTLGEKNEVHKEVPIESVDEDAEEANGNETIEDKSVQKNESTETITADEQTITTEQKKREESEVPNLSHKQNDADVCSEGENADDKTDEKNANNESDPEVIPPTPPKPKSKTQSQTAMKNIDAFDLKLHDISNVSGMESEINMSGLKYDDEGKNIGMKYACNKCPHTFTMISGYNTHLFHVHKIRDVKKYPPWVIFPPRNKSKNNDRQSQKKNKPAATGAKQDKKETEMKDNNTVYSCNDCYKQFSSQKKMRKHYRYCGEFPMDMSPAMNSNLQHGRKKESIAGQGKRSRQMDSDSPVSRRRSSKRLKQDTVHETKEMSLNDALDIMNRHKKKKSTQKKDGRYRRKSDRLEKKRKKKDKENRPSRRRSQ